ncbi:hypothetical protein ABTX71_01560 [Streptomyces parvulus]|uniref:hypothetical protein n=1 Tax=Streptomyces parvulus TaxID=146923 RepID=UPI003333B445
MAFPLDMLTEFFIDGAWAKVPTYERDPVEVDYGVPERSAQADPGRLSITVNNRDGRFSPRNPLSPYFGKIGRNTRARLSLPGGEARMEVDGTPDSAASTPDHASLDITGDLDVRWEGEADWYAAGAQMLIGKWSETDGERSWHMRLEGAQLRILATRNGSTGASGFWPLPALPRRAAFRITLDADTGSGMLWHAYWAESMDGPWTSLGAVPLPDSVVIFSGPAPLSVAPRQLTLPTSGIARYPAAGRVYRAQVRSGINGTIVANPDFRAQAPGVTSFADSAGRTWTLAGNAEIRDRHDLFLGEVSEWPQSWTPDEADSWVSMTASGILRRMSQGKKALQSTLRRSIPRFSPLAYWPLEEGSAATQAYSPIPGVPTLALSGVDWASVDTLPASSPLPALSAPSGGPLPSMMGRIPGPKTTLTSWTVSFIYRIDQPPAVHRTALRILSTGTVAQWLLQMSASSSRVLGFDADGNTIVSNVIGTSGNIFNAWVRIRFVVTQSGGNVNWRIDWINVNNDAGGFGTSLAGSIGRPTAVASPNDGYSTDLNGMALGHISVWPADNSSGHDGAFSAWTGESASGRMMRLAREEGVPLAFVPGTVTPQLVGVQTPDTLLSLFQKAADSDAGMLVENRNTPGLIYRERSSMYSQEPKLVLSYNQAPGLAAPLEPVDDDLTVRNDRTVKREGGSEGRAVLDEGPLSVQDPPAGIGLYDDSVSLSLHRDEQTEPIAYWRLWLGTQDGPRYPRVRIWLHKAPALIPQVRALREGDVVRITDLPAHVGFGHVDLIVSSFHHTMRLTQWTAELNCVPAAPWAVSVVGDLVRGRVDANPGGSTLALPSSATDPQLLVHTPSATGRPARPWISSAGPAPTYPAEFPFDIAFGGETARVTGCVPSAYDQFGRTLSGGWGVADCGFTWVGAGGAAADRSVSSGAGVLTLTANPGDGRFQRIISQITDCEVVTRTAVSAVATGAGIISAVMMRYLDIDNFYRARISFEPGGVLRLSLTRAYTQLGGSVVVPFTYTAGAWVWMRARLTGHRLQLRVWPDGQPEPGRWDKDETVTSGLIDTGQVGVMASVFGGNTNAAPGIRYDDFQVVTPQLLTVQRSLNGAVKPHTVGAEVRLAQPAVTAL